MKKIKPHSSSALSLLVTLALKVLRFVDLLAETKIAFLIRNQTQAPAAVALLLISAIANREYGAVPFHFANGRYYMTCGVRGRA